MPSFWEEFAFGNRAGGKVRGLGGANDLPTWLASDDRRLSDLRRLVGLLWLAMAAVGIALFSLTQVYHCSSMLGDGGTRGDS
jgi:hypothetical protein